MLLITPPCVNFFICTKEMMKFGTIHIDLNTKILINLQISSTKFFMHHGSNHSKEKSISLQANNESVVMMKQKFDNLCSLLSLK